jgi:hypothetical protein
VVIVSNYHFFCRYYLNRLGAALCNRDSTPSAINWTAIAKIKNPRLRNNRVCIQIHNGGTPIPADILPQLTKPFFTTKASGTGLGLALAEPTGGNRQTDCGRSLWGVWDRVGGGDRLDR